MSYDFSAYAMLYDIWANLIGSHEPLKDEHFLWSVAEMEIR